jgi:hypothetical protein
MISHPGLFRIGHTTSDPTPNPCQTQMTTGQPFSTIRPRLRLRLESDHVITRAEEDTGDCRIQNGRNRSQEFLQFTSGSRVSIQIYLFFSDESGGELTHRRQLAPHGRLIVLSALRLCDRASYWEGDV